MKRTSYYVSIICLLWALSVIRADAYALLGPYEPWMDTTNGFRLPGDIGGPMEVDKGYRWNVPVVTYAYDQSFLAYFGTNGVAAVESAIGILNNLPGASQININDYPLDTTGNNYPLLGSGLVDLKSTTLRYLVQQMGLYAPTRAAFCLRNYSPTDTNVFNLIDRNYDPDSLAPSTSVNGVLYGYAYYFYSPENAQALAFPLTSDLVAFSAVAESINPYTAPGTFYTGLTRDDVAGLSYLLATNNFKVEPLLPDVHAAGAAPAQFVNVARRAGVNKVTFVRGSLDPFIGQFLSPISVQYTDTFVSNGIVVTQQLERTVSTPDIVFSAVATDAFSGGAICTQATNWLNNAGLNGNTNGAGPGIIRPHITIAFQKGIDSTVTTGDSQTNGFLMVDQSVWSSFDGTTNPPIIYPQAAAGIGQMNVTLVLVDPRFYDLAGSNSFTWQLPVPVGRSVTMQRTVDLKNWYSFCTVTNLGADLRWLHFGTEPSGFFRVVPVTP